jgi:hypothetical protein
LEHPTAASSTASIAIAQKQTATFIFIGITSGYLLILDAGQAVFFAENIPLTLVVTTVRTAYKEQQAAGDRAVFV